MMTGVNLYYKAQFGSVLNKRVSSFQSVLNRGVALYWLKEIPHIKLELVSHSYNKRHMKFISSST